MPPDRNAPSGTSASIRSFTASRSSESNCAIASPSVQFSGARVPRSATSRADQYATGAAGAPERSPVTVSEVPGGSL